MIGARLNKRLYKLHWRIESAFNGLQDFRRIAIRYDRLARNYLASVCLAAALVWLDCDLIGRQSHCIIAWGLVGGFPRERALHD